MPRSSVPLVPPESPWLTPKASLAPAPGQGQGLFAVESIEEGELVVVWGGEYGGAAFAAQARLEGRPVMQWDEDLFSTGSVEDHPAYRINHSCDSNVWMEGPVALTARRAIGVHEQLTIDYALFLWDESETPEWPCSCGSPLCRGRVSPRDWRRPELRAVFGGRFSPLIEKKIEAEFGAASGQAPASPRTPQ